MKQDAEKKKMKARLINPLLEHLLVKALED